MSRRAGSLSVIFVAFAMVPACGGGQVAVDAGSDGGFVDAAPDCRTDLECDDGLVCNGTEHCASGHCAAGTAMRCDDAVSCTTDSCSEAMRGCLSRVPDLDGDGFGAASCLDTTGTPLGTDCDDTDANRYPGNREVCDAAMHDEDCDTATHGGVDADMDGFEDARCCNGSHCGDDCDDAHPSAHPGATEVCNLVDDDCDTMIDEGVATTGFVDADRDGFGDPTMPLSACVTRAGFAADGTDCDDTNAARNPAQPEFCDSVDNDCDTTVDESAGAVTWYADHDGDGFGSASSGTTSSCVPPAGYALRGTDCNDAAPGINPASAELCNAIDDDCNGTADYAIAAGDLEDDDHDGLADAHCPAPFGVDCDDRDATSGPGAVESCDGRDNDCDGRIDEGATEVAFYRDADGDGFGDSGSVVVGCTQPTGFVRRAGDCDDTSVSRAPGHAEACNAIDDDCDGATDEGDASASCALVGSIAACVGGACVSLGCTTGYGDCSASVPGCETDVTSDPDHCGSCAACPTPVSDCRLGSCGPLLGSLGVLSGDAGDVRVERVIPIEGSNDVVILGNFQGVLFAGAADQLVSNGLSDGFGFRMRPNGTRVWAAQWGGTAAESMYAAAETPDGSAFVIGGEICSGSLCGGPTFQCFAFWQRFASAAAPACPYASGISSSGHAELRAIALERVGATTYVYAAGTWTGSATGGLGSAQGIDSFVLRAREVPASQPIIEWAIGFRSAGDEIVEDLVLQGSSNLVVVGSTTGATDFGLGPTAHPGFSDAFVVDVNRATGVVSAATQFGTPTGNDAAVRVIALPTGEVAITGTFASGTLGVSGVAPSGTGSKNAFLIGLDAAALTSHWAVSLVDDVAVSGLALAGTELVVSGDFGGALALGRGTLTTSGGRGAFLAAFDATSGASAWGRATSGGFGIRSGGVAARSDGSLLWEIDHQGPTSLAGSSVGGTDLDMATVVVTP